MRRDELIRTISRSTNIKTPTVRAVLDAFQDVIAESLTVGEPVGLYGFGTFEIKSRSPRVGRNPHTGESVEIPSRALPSFKPSDVLKARISGDTTEKKPDTKSHRSPPAK